VRRLLDVLRDLPRAIGYGPGPRLASWLRKQWVLLRHPHANVQFLGPVHIGPGFSLHIPNGGSFVVGPNVEFRRGFRAEISGEGRISIGAQTVCTYDVLMLCSTAIDIGEHCGFGQNTLIVDGKHLLKDLDRPPLEQGFELAPIKIANGVAVHSKCTVTADVGERAVLGANSVVTRPVPPYTVVVGAPARPVDYFGPPGGEPPELADKVRSAESV
jgi:acetyltransferase-like isoleucine patch superfamily enzyme